MIYFQYYSFVLAVAFANCHFYETGAEWYLNVSSLDEYYHHGLDKHAVEYYYHFEDDMEIGLGRVGYDSFVNLLAFDELQLLHYFHHHNHSGFALTVCQEEKWKVVERVQEN